MADDASPNGICDAGITRVASTHALHSSRRTVYPERLQLRVPKGFTRAVDVAAKQANCATPEFIRRILMDALAERGVNVAKPKAAAQ